MKCKGKGLRPPHPCTPTSSGEQSRRLWRAFLEATADAAVRARRDAVAEVERTVTLAPAKATAMAQARTPTIEVPAIRDIGRLTAVCRAREQCPFKTACCRNGEVGRIARRGRADQRAIRAVAEVVRIADDIQAVIVVIAAVHPVINIVPPAFDVAILREAVAVAACRGRTGVVTHRVGLTVVHLGIARRAASADALTVPIGKLHKEQHVHIPELSEIHLPEVSAEVMNTAARLASRDVYLLCGARGGLITAGAVITADVGV